MNHRPFNLLLWCVVAGACVSSAFAQSTTLISVDSFDQQGNQESRFSSITPDGRYVAFHSWASNLDPIDSNGVRDVFVRDCLLGETYLVSKSMHGGVGNGESYHPSISADGRFVAFLSIADNLADNLTADSNWTWDTFVHDRNTGITTLVSMSSGGTQGDGPSYFSSISADGNVVAFTSFATNLVLSDTNGTYDIFVHDRASRVTTMVSVSTGGVQGNALSYIPSISANGRFVAFDSQADNLVSGDTNTVYDVFVRDCWLGITSRVSVHTSATEGDDESIFSSLSADGRYVAFQSLATNLVNNDRNGVYDVFVHDRTLHETHRVSIRSSGIEGDNHSIHPSISADGWHVAFQSEATNLVDLDTNGRTDVFVRDRSACLTSRVSVSSSSVQGNDFSDVPAISGDGRYVAFSSQSFNLVPVDGNGVIDVFLHERGVPSPSLTVAGACPGTVTLTVAGATVCGDVEFACGAAGTFLKMNSPCEGALLGITPPALTAMRTADGSGVAVLVMNVSVALCGLSVQALDLTSCEATNLVVL